MARIRAAIGLVPYPLKTGRLEGLAERCTSILKEGVATLESLRTDVRAGGDVKATMKGVSSCTAGIPVVEDYGLSPPQCQTSGVAPVSVALHSLHGEMALPFPRPAACCISNHRYASHVRTSATYMPIGESRPVQHFARPCHDLGHRLLHPLDDPRLAPLREGLGRAEAAVDACYTGPARGSAGQNPAHAADMTKMWRAQWGGWIMEAFCGLPGVFGGGGACQRMGIPAHGGQEAPSRAPH